MKVLVTGASGFIGRRLVDRLASGGHAVVAYIRGPREIPELSRANVSVARGSITNPDALARAASGCEAVVHLAAATGVADPKIAYMVNVSGTERLLQAARQARVGRFVFISSISAQREKLGPYGRTKRRGEELVRSSGMPFVILRPSLVYGEGTGGLFATLTRALRTLPAIPVIGSGQIELDPIHVDDVCLVIEQCLTRRDVIGKSYDLLGPDRVTFKQFLERVAAELGVKKPYVHVPAAPALLLARALGLVSSRPPLSVDNVLGLTSPAHVDRGPAVRDFPIAWTPLSSGLKAIVRA